MRVPHAYFVVWLLRLLLLAAIAACVPWLVMTAGLVLPVFALLCMAIGPINSLLRTRHTCGSCGSRQARARSVRQVPAREQVQLAPVVLLHAHVRVPRARPPLEQVQLAPVVLLHAHERTPRARLPRLRQRR